jgi:SAM-dependent methyltransferase
VTRPWFESFFGEDYFEIYRDFFTPEQTAAEVDGIVTGLGLGPGARVLDLACGHGRHAIPLAERGFAVTGYDLSEPFLARARDEAAARGVALRFVQGDMRALPFEEEFDAAINVFTSFGYFADEADDLEALRRVRRALLETLHRDGLLARFRPHREYTTSGGARVVRDYTWDLARDRMEDRVRLTRRDGSEAEWLVSTRMRSLSAWLALLRGAGLEPSEWYGGLDGSELGLASRRLVVVAERGARAPRTRGGSRAA